MTSHSRAQPKNAATAPQAKVTRYRLGAPNLIRPKARRRQPPSAPTQGHPTAATLAPHSYHKYTRTPPAAVRRRRPSTLTERNGSVTAASRHSHTPTTTSHAFPSCQSPNTPPSSRIPPLPPTTQRAPHLVEESRHRPGSLPKPRRCSRSSRNSGSPPLGNRGTGCTSRQRARDARTFNIPASTCDTSRVSRRLYPYPELAWTQLKAPLSPAFWFTSSRR